MSLLPTGSPSTYRYVTTGSTVPIVTTSHYPVTTGVTYQRPILGSSVMAPSIISPGVSSTTTKRTVTVSHEYGAPTHSTTFTTTASHVPGYPASIPVYPPSWAASPSSVLTDTGSTSSLTKVRYEWRTDSAGVLRQVLVDESNQQFPDPNASQASESSLVLCAPDGGSMVDPPTINVTPIEDMGPPGRQVSVESVSTEATANEEVAKNTAAELAEATRIARMRAAGELAVTEAKMKEEEEKRRAALEAEVAQAREQSATTESLQRQLQEQLEAMKMEMEAMRRQYELDAEEKRRQQEEERRRQMEQEIQQLKQLEEEKRRSLEEEVQRLRDSQQAQQLRTEKEQELLQLQQQQAALTQTMRVEETAKTLMTAQLGRGGEFLAIDHPFKSVMIKLHEMHDLGQGARDILQRNGGILCDVSIGSHRLRAESRMTNHGAQTFGWEDLLTFPYMNEKYVRITCFSSMNSAVLCGVKFELEPFLLDPGHMCGRHELHVVDQKHKAAGILGVTLQLSSEFIAKPFIALRSEPAPAGPSTTIFSFSSVVTPFKSLVIGVDSATNMTIPLPPGAKLICRIRFGQVVLSSHSLPANQEAGKWNVEYTLPLSGERNILFEILLDRTMQLLGRGTLDLDTLLMSGIAVHAITVALKDSKEDIIGNLCTSFEFSSSAAAASVRETSLRSSPSASIPANVPGGGARNELMQSMLSVMGGNTLAAPQSIYAGGSMLADSGFGWGLLPMVPGRTDMLKLGSSEAASALIPRPTNCKVQIHHLRNIAHDVLRGGLDPAIKVFVGDEVGNTMHPKITGDTVKWREAFACFNFKIDVDRMLSAAKDDSTAAAMAIEFYNKKKLVGAGRINLLPVITVSSGYFSGDVQLFVSGTPIRSGLANVTVQTF